MASHFDSNIMKQSYNRETFSSSRKILWAFRFPFVVDFVDQFFMCHYLHI